MASVQLTQQLQQAGAMDSQVSNVARTLKSGNLGQKVVA
jgi:hypothetical protein